MRAPYSGEAIRQTERYLEALRQLEAVAESHRFEGPNSFYAWERLLMLIGRLRARYDDYELEGDVAPVRREVDAFMADLAGLHVRPDAGLVGQLTAFIDWLEQPPRLEIVTSVVPPAPGAAWPETILTVHPATLEAMLKSRSAPLLPPPA